MIAAAIEGGTDGEGGGAIREVRWYERGGVEPAPADPGRALCGGWTGPAAIGRDAIERAARCLEAGGVVAHPTSTVYGLGGRPKSRIDARIAALKGRSPGPLIRLAASREALMAALPGARWTRAGRRLAEAFWPGPLTLILDDGSEAGVAVRVDPDPVVRRLLERAGGLMTSTSLNLAGQAPARTRAEASDALAAMQPGDGPVGWLDAGDLPRSAASTLVRVRGGAVEVLREGAVAAREIERRLGRAGAAQPGPGRSGSGGRE